MASEMPAKARRRAIALAAEGGSRGKGAVVITTYGMVSSNPEQFAPAIGGAGRWIERGQSRQHVWDYVILDEGHKIKNASTKWVSFRFRSRFRSGFVLVSLLSRPGRLVLLFSWVAALLSTCWEPKVVVVVVVVVV